MNEIEIDLTGLTEAETVTLIRKAIYDVGGDPDTAYPLAIGEPHALAIAAKDGAIEVCFRYDFVRPSDIG